MKIQQTIQKCLDDWTRISGLDFWMKMTRYTFPQGTADFLLLKSLLSSGRILPYASPTAAAVCTS